MQFPRSIALLALVAASAATHAEQCTKDFQNYFVRNDGVLGVYQNSGAWWYPCSMSTTINGVTPEACRAALATYLNAKTQGHAIALSYSGTCAALDSSSNINEGFFWFGVYW